MRVMPRRQFKQGLTAVFLPSVVAGIWPISSSAWDLQSTVTLGEYYSSNISLVSDNERDDWVTRLSPDFLLTHAGRRLDFNVSYAPELLYFADDSDWEFYNTLGSGAVLNVVAERLYLDADAALFQANVDPDRALASSNLYQTGNRSDGTRWQVGPRWEQPLFARSQLSAFYRVGHLNYDDVDDNPDTPENERLAIDLEDEDWLSGSVLLGTRPEAVGRGGYELGYEYNELDYERSDEVKWANARLRLMRSLASSVEAWVLGALESDLIDEPASGSLDEFWWELGANADLGEDQIAASFGHRYFGTTYRFKWNRERDDRAYWIAYDETPSTTDYRSLRILTPAAPAQPTPIPPPPDSGLEQPGRADVSIVKRFDAGTAWTRYRSRLAWSIYWEEREDEIVLTPQTDEETPVDETSYGTAIDFSWDVGIRTAASLTASWTRRDFGAGDDDSYTISGDLTRELGVRTSLAIGMGWQTRDGGPTADYDEYWARVELTRRFY